MDLRSSSSSLNIEKRATINLAQHIEQISSEKNLENAVCMCAELVPGLTAAVTYTGQRIVRHEAYEGTGNLNRIAKVWMSLATRCYQEDALFRVRLQQVELGPQFQALYETTKKELQESWMIVNFFNGMREFTIGCQHCLGPPQYCIPHGERLRNALFVREDLFLECWGEQKSTPSMSYSGRSWKRAKPEQLREALARGIEG